MTNYHGTTNGYTNHRCRCAPCRGAWATYIARRKAERYALRVRVDGVLTAAHLPPEKHGKESTYTNHGCGCLPCLAAHTAATRARRERRHARRHTLQAAA